MPALRKSELEDLDTHDPLVDDIFREITLDNLKATMSRDPILVDVRGFFDRGKAVKKGFLYKTL